MPGAWAAKHPAAVRVAPNQNSSATKRPLAAPRPAANIANANIRIPAQRAAVNTSTVRRPLAAAHLPNATTRIPAQRAATVPVNNLTVRRPLAAPTRPANVANANTRAPAQRAPVPVNRSTVRRPLAASIRPANVANANACAPAPRGAANHSVIRRPLSPILAQRADAPVTVTPPKPHTVTLPGVWKTPEKRSSLSQKLLRKVDASRKTLAQKGGEPIVPKEEPEYIINAIVKKSSPISRYLAPQTEEARLSLVDRAVLPYSAPQPKKAPSAKSSLPEWKPKTGQKSSGTSSRGKSEQDWPLHAHLDARYFSILTNVRASGPIRDVNERGEANDDDEAERGRRTEKTSINKWRESSTDSYISDDGIAFISYPSPDPFAYDYDFDFGEGLFGTLFAHDSDGSVDYPSTDSFDFGYDTNTNSGEGHFETLFTQEEHSPCGGRGTITPRTERAHSYISVSKFEEIVGGLESLNKKSSSENLEESASSAEQLVDADQPEEENTSGHIEDLASTAESISGPISFKFSELVGFDRPEEENTSEGPKEVAGVEEQKTGRESEFQEIVAGFGLSNEENTLKGAEETATREEQLAVVENQPTDTTHQATLGQLEEVYREQIIQLEQAAKEVEKSELRLRNALDRKAEINRKVIETIKRLEQEFAEQNSKEKEARQLAERSYSRLRRAIVERSAIYIDEKVEKSYARLLAAITAQAVEYQKIVESFETVEKPVDITNRNKEESRESVNRIASPHKQSGELKEIDYILKVVPTSSPEPEASGDSEQSPIPSGGEHGGYNTRPTSARSVCSVSSDRCISSIVLSAEELQWILNRPEVKQAAKTRDHWLGIERGSASPKAEVVNGGELIDGNQESGYESETF